MNHKEIPLNPAYVVYSNGQILSHYTYRYLSPTNNGNGYMNVKLFIENVNGKKVYKTVYVHRLVAEAFLPNPSNLPQVNHIDGNKANNSVDNLEWCSAKHNTLHALSTGLSTRKQPKLSKEELVAACNLVLQERYSTEQLAKHFNVCKNIRQWIIPVAEELGLLAAITGILAEIRQEINTAAQQARVQAVFGTADDGSTTPVFATMSAAAKHYGCNPGNISNSINKHVRCKGFRWQYKN